MGSNNGGGRKPTSPTVSDRHMTLEEIAEIMGCTRERVRQIEQRALMKLRKRLRLEGIKPEDLLGDMVDTPAKPTRIRPD
jgi:Sigma-70, region 4